MNGKKWLYGLGAAFIGGGASALSAGLGVMFQDASHFNLGAGLLPTLKVAGTAFLINGILAAGLYLKQSPLPPAWDGLERRNGPPEKHIG